MRKNLKNKNGGFVALISTILICASILIVLTTLSVSEFYGRYDILESELKEKSVGLAEACGDMAILKIINESTYTGNETMNISGDSCTIGTISTSGNIKSFTVSSLYKNYNTYFKIKVDKTTFEILSWEESPTP